MVISKIVGSKEIFIKMSIVPKILCKVGCLFSMAVVSLLLHAACNGPCGIRMK